MKQPLVSIGVPIYNNDLYIQTAIESLSSQTYRNIEIIISDNCSTDNTFQVCQGLAKKDKRIRLFRQKLNHGYDYNFNFVLHKAKGKFFMWAAGDDIRDTNCIEEMVKLFNENPSCVLATSAMSQFHKSRKVYLYPTFNKYSHPYDTARIFLHNITFSPVMVYGMYKTGMLINSGGFHKDKRPIFGGAGEFITAYRILLKGDLGYVNKPLLHKRDSGFYLSQYEILESGYLPPTYIRNIWRYFKLPALFFFDLYYGLLYTIHSRLPVHHKLIVCKYCLDNYLMEHVNFLLTILRGIYFFLLGIYRRALHTNSSLK